MVTPVQAGPPTTESDAHPMTELLATLIQLAPDVHGLEIVAGDADHGIIGFTFRGEPISLSWNVTP